MTAKSKSSRILLAMGVSLIVTGLAFNKWVLEAFFISVDQISGLSTLVSIVVLQVIFLFAGVLTIIFYIQNPEEGFKSYARTHGKLIEILILASIFLIWVMSATPTEYYKYMFGIYRPWLFATNIVLTTIGILAIYTLRDLSSWKKRIVNSGVFVATIAFISLMLELMAATGFLDYRELFIPRGIGFYGPHNRLFEPEGYFHRPVHDHFKDNLPGDAVISLGVKTDRRYPAEYAYDAYGFRNSKDVTRPFALLVGDSFIEGYKITQESIVSERLSRMLGKDTFNLAQADYGPYEELSALRTHITRLKPKVVVWFFYEGNDLPNVDYQDFLQKNKTWVIKQDHYSERSFFSNMSTAAVMWSSMWMKNYRTKDLADKRSGYFIGADQSSDTTMYFGMAPPRVNQQQLRRLKSVLDKVKSLSDENEAQLLFVYIPTKYSVYKSQLKFPIKTDVDNWEIPDLANRLAGLCEKQNIPFLDLNPFFQQAIAGQHLVYFLDDEHWTPAGHEVAAREVMNRIQKAGWLDNDIAISESVSE